MGAKDKGSEPVEWGKKKPTPTGGGHVREPLGVVPDEKNGPKMWGCQGVGGDFFQDLKKPLKNLASRIPTGPVAIPLLASGPPGR